MGLTLQALLLAASATRVFASCAHGTFLMPRAEGNGAVEVGKFGYKGSIGPLNWAALETPANILCATGARQSPIDMVNGAFTLLQASDVQLTVNDMPQGAEFENLGTTVEVVAQGGTLKSGGKQFELQQFHFHLPSEHLDNGTSQAMEMHMVFESAQKEIAVVGVYINVADQAGARAAAGAGAGAAAGAGAGAGAGAAVPAKAKNPAPRRLDRRAVAAPTAPTALLETIFSTVDKISTPGTKVKTPPLVMSEVVNVLKANAFQAYSGSLTTPPCSEGVSWHVSTARLAVSPATFVKARDVIGFNARFPQNSLGQPNLLMISAVGSASAAVRAAGGAAGNARVAGPVRVADPARAAGRVRVT